MKRCKEDVDCEQEHDLVEGLWEVNSKSWQDEALSLKSEQTQSASPQN